MLRNTQLFVVVGVGAVSLAGFFVFRFLRGIRRRSKREECLRLLLQREDVRTRDPLPVEEKIRRLSNNWHGNAGNLQVVSDFDMTLTHFKSPSGNTCATCHGVLEKSTLMPSWFCAETKKLKEYYFPLEYSPKLSKQEKARLMQDWWRNAHDLLVRTKINRSALPQIVGESQLLFRDGAGDLLSTLARHSIPLCIVSAGVGDILEEAIRCRLGSFDNITVVANRMEFDDTGVVMAMSEPIIHSYNKANAVERHCDSFSSRPIFLLLGDSLGDPDMVPKNTEPSAILKIGFLNDKTRVADLLPLYRQAYDIVLLGDGDMTVVNLIVSILLGDS